MRLKEAGVRYNSNDEESMNRDIMNRKLRKYQMNFNKSKNMAQLNCIDSNMQDCGYIFRNRKLTLV